MNPTPAAAPLAAERVKEFLQTIKSDDLPAFAQTLERMLPHFNQVGVFKVDLILDANVVMSDLLWLARKRKKLGARTGLTELLDCKVVVAYAPHFLKREMAINIPEVAAKHGVDLALLNSLWSSYRAKITFVAVGGPPKGGKWRDPKDVPYLRLQRKLECLIVSNDSDLPAMGARVVHVQVFGPLRAYSRSAAIEYQMKASGAISAAIMVSMAEGLVSAIKRIPAPILWGGAILSLLALAHPTSRRKILDVAEVLIAGGGKVMPVIADSLKPFFDAHSNARDQAQHHLTNSKAGLLV